MIFDLWETLIDWNHEANARMHAQVRERLGFDFHERWNRATERYTTPVRQVLTGVGAVVNTAQVRVGASVAIVGLGGVGLAALIGAQAAGARHDKRAPNRHTISLDGQSATSPPNHER